ncbi:MAG: hypothetical protein J5789_01235 [Oscillospiraceae bacterium]|nr:hypothetical protein [Oscillospiraceae bacterium]
MICPNCGRETTGKFCPFCGSKLNVETAAPAANDEVLQDQSSEQNPTQFTASIPQYNETNPNPYSGASQPQYNAPGQSYNGGVGFQQNPAPGYAPQQSFNSVQQPMGGYQDGPLGPVGMSPASVLVRKLASSPLYLFAALLTTIVYVVSAYFTVKALISNFEFLDRCATSYTYWLNKGEYIGNIVGYIVTLALYFFTLIAIWRIFTTAASKRRERMGTGSLTFFQVFYVIALVFAILGVILLTVLMVMLIAADSYSDFFQDAILRIDEALAKAGIVFPALEVGFRTFLYIFLGVLLACMLLATIYMFRIIKSLKTAKEVIKTGVPDDRVSVFAGVMMILGALGNVYSGVYSYMIKGSGSAPEIITGVSLILSAAAAVCFAIILFRFRSGMRSLGVRHGVKYY